MKKITITAIIIVLLSLISINNVFAITTVDSKINTTKTELKQNEKVEITFKLDNFNDVKKGINAYKATLKYDKSIFEEVVESDFECQNYWEELKYNPQTGEFVAIKKVGSKNPEAVVKITLKVRSGVEAGATSIKIKDITTSEGKKDIEVPEQKITLNIIKDQVTIPTKPDKDHSGNTNSNLSSGVGGTSTGVVTKPNTNNGNNITDDNNNQMDNSGNNTGGNEVVKPTNPVINDKDNNGKEPEKIKNKTNTCFWLLILTCIAVIIIISIIIYQRRKNDNIIDSKKRYMLLFVIGILFIETIGIAIMPLRLLGRVS